LMYPIQHQIGTPQSTAFYDLQCRPNIETLKYILLVVLVNIHSTHLQYVFIFISILISVIN
jgi:hypothetical protein